MDNTKLPAYPVTKFSTCRGCGKRLAGDGSQMSMVYDPDTKEPAKWNYYGGWVCSERCDYESSLALERSMPRHIGQRSLGLGSAACNDVKKNWKETNK